jgi:hypothetical protein
LGITFPGDAKASAVPVSEDRLQNFADFIRWTFGTSESARLLKDSRQLTQWGKILVSSEAVSYLRRVSSPTFERAWARSGGESESVLNSLLQAADSLEESIPLIPIHKEEPGIEKAVERCTQFMLQILRDFPELRQRFQVNGNV